MRYFTAYRPVWISGQFLALALFCGSPMKVHGQSNEAKLLTLPEKAEGAVWDRTTSRFYVSSGTSVLRIDPETAQIEATIPVDGHAKALAVSDDGQYIYVALGESVFPYVSRGVIHRYKVQSAAVDLQIAVGTHPGTNTYREVQAMVVLPGQPTSVLTALSGKSVTIFDGNVARPNSAPLNIISLYVRQSDGMIVGTGNQQPGFANPEAHWFKVVSNGVVSARSVPLDGGWNSEKVTWNANLGTNRNPFLSSVLDLSAGATIGRVPLPPSNGEGGACVMATDNSSTSVIAYEFKYLGPDSTARLVQYGLKNFQPEASVNITGLPTNFGFLSDMCGSTVATWGADGMLVTNGTRLVFVNASGMTPIVAPRVPSPTRDAAGTIRLAIPANGLAYDSVRNLLWASVPGTTPGVGNSVVSIDPTSGQVRDVISAGSEPALLALSSDGSHLFASLRGAPGISSVDLITQGSTFVSLLDAEDSTYWSASALVPIAGRANSFVTVRLAGSGSARSSVVAYDAGVRRERRVEGGIGTQYRNYVQGLFGSDAPEAIYAVNEYQTHFDGTHDVYRLLVEESGVKVDRKLSNLLLGTRPSTNVLIGPTYRASIVDDAGWLYSSQGQVISPDATRLRGIVALAPSYGIPIPFTERNSVVYVQNLSTHISAHLYDLVTFRPLMTIPLLTGPPCGCTEDALTSVAVTAAVRAGNDAIAIAANGEIVIASLTSFQPWPSSTGTVRSISSAVQQVAMPVNAVQAIPGTSKLLLATPSTAGGMGNSIVTFNTDTGRVENATFIGGEPSIVSPTPDGSSAYVYLSGEYRVARISLATQSRDLVFAPDPRGGSDLYDVFDIAASADGGVAASYQGSVAFRGVLEALPGSGTVAVFDDGVLRPKVDSNSKGPFAGNPSTVQLAFNDTGSILYGYNRFVDTFELKRLAVSGQGVEWLSSVSGLVSGFATKIQYTAGLIYTSNGRIVDPEKSLVVGNFTDAWLEPARAGAVAVDSAAGRAYFATTNGILMFDLRTQDLLGRLTIQLDEDTPQSLARAGANTLAFHTLNHHLYLVNIAAIPVLPVPVPSPQRPFIASGGIVPIYSSVSTVQPGSWISIYGASLASSTAEWSGDFPTTLAGTSVSINNQPAYLSYVSPNLINAQAPDDSTTGPVSVTVATAGGTASGLVSLSRFGPSLALLDSRYAVAQIATPDGSGSYGGGMYELAGPSGRFAFTTRPVKAGEILTLYGVGFGPTNPPVPAGHPFSGAAPTTNGVTVTIGGKPARVLFSGITSTGLYQLNVEVPATVAGDQSVQATVGGVHAPEALVAVQ